MTLGELIKELESVDPNLQVKQGFNSPHSYRGTYEELAFEPCGLTTAGEMLAAAKEALGTVYQGYKGGDYLMKEYTTVHIANYGDCGEEISPLLMKYMLGKV